MSNELQKTDSPEAALALVPTDVSAAAMEMAVGMGDFSRFQPSDKLRYIAAVCQTTRLNPLTLPFRILKLDGREILYATADCGAQLRARDKVSVSLVNRAFEHGCVIITARASTPDGRKDEATGAVPLVYPEKTSEWVNGQKRYVPHPKAGKPLEGLDFANAIKKAETQAKRRVTLSLSGLGIPDESELQPERTTVDTTGGVEMPETAEDLAAKVNASLTAGEKEKSIEAEVVTDPIKPEPPAPEPPQPITHAPEPEQPPADVPPPFEEPPAKPADDSHSRDATARELELVFSDNKDCVSYCIFKNMLAKGQGLSAIDQTYAGKILKNPKGFIRTVEAWVKNGRK